MDYDLGRIDYTLCGITYPDALKILPATEQKIQQKFAIGDKNGVLQCLSIKDEEPVVHFKTLPGKPITSVQLPSSIGTNADKIFAASGNEVKGYTRKGKVFLSIETSVSETITSMCVLGSDLILCCGRTVTFYRELKELYSHICDDRVLDAVAFATPNNTRVRILVITANKEAIIIENGQTQKRVYIAAGPTRIIVPLSLHSTEVCAYYGASDGSIGLIFQEETNLSYMCLVNGHGLGSVMCAGWFLNSFGTHLAVGQHDGSIQLYLINTENFLEKPRLKFTYFSGEPVTSVAGGYVGSEEPELLISTFSGRIFGLRPRRLVSAINNLSTDALAVRRSKLETEIARLEKQTVNERDKYQKNTRSMFGGVSAPPLLDIEYEGSNNEQLLATVRCQAGTRRLWLRIRVVSIEETKMEGISVFIYILPTGSPRVARLIKLHLPILPQYSKFENIEVEDAKRSWCQMRISGGFSVAEMTSWLTEILPGELPRPASNIVFARSHSTLGTYLVCRYQRGSAVFKSDNISTIMVMKTVISNCCVKRSIRADISCDVPENACLISFQQIRDRFKFEHEKKKDIEIRKALGSLDLDTNMINDETQPLLCKEYLNILKLSDVNKDESCFEELIDTIEHWYLDWYKLSLKSNYYGNGLTKLKAALKGCQVDEIEQILKP
ncbi:unnamed protein product, partial [Brenthis ino]